MADCIFCSIVTGDIPADKVVETEDLLAFRDIEPKAPTHVLVIPKRHIENAAVITPGDGPLLGQMLELSRQVAEKEGIDASGYRLVFNVGDDAQNTVPHLHLHVMGGRKFAWPPG